MPRHERRVQDVGPCHERRVRDAQRHERALQDMTDVLKAPFMAPGPPHGQVDRSRSLGATSPIPANGQGAYPKGSARGLRLCRLDPLTAGQLSPGMTITSPKDIGPLIGPD